MVVRIAPVTPSVNVMMSALLEPATKSTWAGLEQIPPSITYRCPNTVGPATPGNELLAAAPCAKGMPFFLAACCPTTIRSPV